MKFEVKNVNGYAYGAIQPSVLIYISGLTSDMGEQLKHLTKLKDSLPLFDDPTRFSGPAELCNQKTAPALFVTIIDFLNRYCGDQRFTAIKVFREGNSICFSVPTLSTALITENVVGVSSLLSKSNNSASPPELLKYLEILKKRNRGLLPDGTNAGNFITAAAARRIPFKIFNSRLVIFGYGSASSIFDSSVTDQESLIGVHLAKSKADTNRLLKISGLPVPEQMRVQHINDAVRFAKDIGYPVVLKPEAEEQGRGVFANIIDEVELRNCFEKSAAKYKNLILEKFISGESYRVHLHNGKVLDAWRMNPARVTGDGNSTIQQLIEIENEKSERKSIHSSLETVPLDTVTELNLQKLGLTCRSIPSAGEIVTLSATSNESRGGSPENYLHSLHPEVAELCSQAANTLRLKVCAVDLISEDASIALNRSNVAICEINSQPQIGDYLSYPHIFDDLLKNLLCDCRVNLTISHEFKEVSINVFNKAVSDVSVQASPLYLLTHGSPTQYYNEIKFISDVLVEEREKIVGMLSNVFPINAVGK